MRSFSVSAILLLLSDEVVGLQLPVSSVQSLVCQRAPCPVMKGKGTRGMPGKGVRPPAAQAGAGFTTASKKRMQQRDFGKSEWTLVAGKNDLGDDVGSTLAVEAGQSPMGVNYIWTLIRGEDGAGAFDGDVSNVYATDGSCRACTFPMVKGSLEGSVVTCGSCGSKFDLEDGSVVEWLPGQGVMGFMAKQLNSKKEPIDAGILRTRVSQSGRVYVRLPDGTLPITKTAADRAAELAAPLTAQEQVKAAQEKAKGN